MEFQKSLSGALPTFKLENDFGRFLGQKVLVSVEGGESDDFVINDEASHRLMLQDLSVVSEIGFAILGIVMLELPQVTVAPQNYTPFTPPVA